MTKDIGTKNAEEGWAIVRYTPPPPRPPADDDDEEDEEVPPSNYKICWWSPYSKNLQIPPMVGWVPYDKLARGNPKLKYFFCESIG